MMTIIDFSAPLRQLFKIIAVTFLLSAGSIAAQPNLTLLSPAGDGGFESGSTFTANGWTVQHYGSGSNNINNWYVGSASTPSQGARAVYISNNGVTGYGYNRYTTQRIMFWRDITFPAGYDQITFSFKIKVNGKANADDLSVFFQNGNTVPPVTTQPTASGNAAPSIANATRIATLSMLGATYVTRTYTLNAGNSTVATTRRLIFYWENANSGGSGTAPGPSIDEISIAAVNPCTPPALTGFSDTTSRCGDGQLTLNASAGQGATVQWYAAANGGTALAIGNSFTTSALTGTTNYYIAAKTGNCESWPRQMVTAEVKPAPDVDLGVDIVVCVDGNESVFLDAGIHPDNPIYLWNDGSTQSSRDVFQSGTYILTVTNQYMCTDSDTIRVDIKQNPMVNLGNDTNICLGTSLELDAENSGSTFLWNTGGSSQQITVQSPGSFSVLVTSANGCKKSDTINVTMMGQLPTVDYIIITNNGISTFTFNPANPRNIVTYDWDFGDGTPHSNEQLPTHTYTNHGDYVVTLTVHSTCGSAIYERYTSIVSIDQLKISDEALLLSPNPARANVAIINHGAFEMEYIDMYGIDGRMIYNEKAKSATHHDLNTEYLPRGMYLIKIVSDKGIITRKLQLQ